MLHTMIFSSLPYADLHRPHTLRAFYNLLRKCPFFSFYYSFPVFTSTYLTRIYKSVTGRVINETIPSGKGKSRKNNNVYTEFKYFQRTLSSFILDSIAVYTTYHLMSQIKVKELTSLLLSIRTLNTLCAPARAFHLEQGEEISVIFFHFVLVDTLIFLLFIPVCYWCLCWLLKHLSTVHSSWSAMIPIHADNQRTLN